MNIIVKYTITFSQAGVDWLKIKRTSSKPATYTKYSNILKKILPDIGSVKIHSITSDRIIQQMKLYDKYSTSMQRSILCVINQILKYSADTYHTAPVTISIKLSKKYIKYPEVLDNKSISALNCFLQKEPDAYKYAIQLCLLTGLRIGEICALRWSDIDNNSQILKVNCTVQRLPDPNNPSHSILAIGHPKSICSKRSIPLPEDAVKILNNCPHNGDFVIGGIKPADPRTMQYRYTKYLKLCGIPHKHFHALRHTFATSCIASGMDVKSLSELLGHANIKTTLNRYVHPATETKRKHLNNLSEYYKV